MITRISTLVVAILISGGILFSVGSPAMAKSAGINNGSIKREAKLIRVIRVKLAKVKVKRISVEKGLIEKGRVNETRARAADPVEAVRQ